MFVWMIIMTNYAIDRPSDNGRKNMEEILAFRLLIGLGANLTPDGYASPREGCVAAVSALADEGSAFVGAVTMV
jgi:hypothetical protein